MRLPAVRLREGVLSKLASSGRALLASTLLLLIAAGGVVPVRAQMAPRGEPALGTMLDGTALHRWTIRDGLPTNSLTGVAYDAEGYLWVATNDGLVRYDGARMVIHTRATHPALPANRFAGIVTAPDGALWFHSDGRYFVRYADGAFTVLPPTLGVDRESSLRRTPDALWIVGGDALRLIHGADVLRVPATILPHATFDVVRDLDRRLWVATRDGGIYVFPPDAYTSADGSTPSMDVAPERILGVDDGLPSLDVRELAVGPGGTVWAATAAGLVALSPTAPSETWLPGRPLLEVAHDAYGRTWVVAEGQDDTDRRVWRIEGRTATPFLGDARFSFQGTFWKGDDNELWMVWSAEQDGQAHLYRLSAEGVPTLAVTLPGQIVEVAPSADGLLWLATTSGLYHVRQQPIQAVPFGAYSATYGLTERTDGSVWAAIVGPGGPARISPDLTATRLPATLGYATVLYETRDGTLWGGSRFCRFEGTICRPVAVGPDRETLHGVYALFEDRSGWLWVSARGELWRGRADLPPLQWRSFSVVDELPHDHIQVFYETVDGALLLGTDGKGLLRVTSPLDADTLAFEVLSEDEGLASNHVRDLHEDDEGLLWIATEDRGLCRLDRQGAVSLHGGALDCLGQDDGLHSNSLHRILDDDHGRLWMNSNQGLFWVARADLDAWARGEVSTVPSVAYGEIDGLPAREGNGGVQQAGLRARDGRLWFPTMGGIAVVDPAAITPPSLPTSLIETIRTGDRTLSVGASEAVVLPPAERDLRVTFTAPTFLRAQSIRFQYRLVGHRDAWEEATAAREAVYTNLPPGRYTFEVRAGAGGAWSSPVALPVHQRASWHETLWFSLALGLGLLGLVYGLVDHRLRRAARRARDLEAAVDAQTETLRRQNTQLEQQTAELEQAAELKTRFLASISHEFRTPLTLTFGPIEDLLRGEYDSVAEARPHFARARSNGRRLLRLINQLLDLSRLGAGAITLNPTAQPNDLGVHVRHLAALFATHAAQRGVALHTVVAAHPFTREFDADVLDKIVVNLLSNAFKFTPAGGTVRVALEAEGDVAVLIVEDTGLGIAPEDQVRVFERFYQVESGPTRSHDGSGVGLALVRELADLHGGTVAVESQLDEGARFTVRLPGLARPSVSQPSGDALPGATPTVSRSLSSLDASLDDASLEDAAPLPEPAMTSADALPGTPRPLVLVVEDNADMRAYLGAQLGRYARVETAADGADGIERARSIVPDLVVTDVMMPRVDGLALCATLKGDTRTSHIPVLLLSARADVESRIAGYDLGADAYLAKPFHAAELRAQVMGLLRERARLQARFAAMRRRAEGPPVKTSPIPAPTTHAAAEPAAQSSLPPREAAFLADLEAAIADGLDDPAFNTERLAGVLALSRRQLQRKLNALTGDSPGGLIREARLDRAATLLAAGELSVKEVAAAVGFRSNSAFGRAFRERHGATPSAYSRVLAAK
ncbi:MAG: ATP-binding protein [Bacteroidota bacterium]